jgi:hypothetical protein
MSQSTSLWDCSEWGNEVNESGLGLCAVVGFESIGLECSCSSTRKLIYNYNRLTFIYIIYIWNS